MPERPQQNLFRWTQWVWPVAIGLAAATAVLWYGANQEVMDPESGIPTTSWELLRSFEWAMRSTWSLLAVLACVLLRDIGYIIRLRILSFQSFSWRQATENILLWELASALTPSVVGGSAVAVVILKRDGMRLGKSLATVFATALLDEAFYLLFVPVVFLWSLTVGYGIFPEVPAGAEVANWGVPALFGLAYAFIATLTATMLFGLVIKPQATHRMLRKLAAKKIVHRWKARLGAWADDLLEASQSMREAPRGYWAKGFLATAASWTARFLTLNMVLLIFYPSVAHGAVMARQLVLWLVLSISPTPGSSGAAELGVPAFLGDLTGLAYMAGVVIIWRTATYFIYIVAGAFVLPEWLMRTQRRVQNAKNQD